MSDSSRAIQKFLEYFHVNFRTKGLELLGEVVNNFSKIPYENISKIIKSFENPDPDSRIRYPAEVMDEHIRLSTGGTCFSLVYFLKIILEDLGFQTDIFMGDMNYGPDIHCAIIVTVQNEKYLVDPGYLLSKPLRLPSGDPVLHETASNFVKIFPDNNGYNVHTIEQNREKWRYLLKFPPVNETEFRNFWQKSFAHNMLNSLLVTRSDDKARMYFRKNRYSRITKTGKINENVKGNEVEFLTRTFGIDKYLVTKALTVLRNRLEDSKHGNTQ